MTPTQFIVEVENRLGWTPAVSAKTPLWKARSIEAMKLKKAMASKKCSFDDLRLALDYSVRTRQSVAPAALCWRVEEARENAVHKVSDVDEQAQAALQWEMAHDLEDSDMWIARFVRVRGEARAEALQLWSQQRGVALEEITADA